jgi:hypothetical protein
MRNAEKENMGANKFIAVFLKRIYPEWRHGPLT